MGLRGLPPQEIVGEAQLDLADVVQTAALGLGDRDLEAAQVLPELIGGSADLAGSNNTIWSGSVDVKDGAENGNYVYFGVREFGMTAICNGLGLHGGFVPYNATFLVFSDYARNAVRMSALLPVQNIYVYTHDSIGLGEDGPTHQPVEHVASLRLIPGLDVWRPCDTVETAVAWKNAIERLDGPTALILTRQGLPHQDRTADQVADIARGAYVLDECDGNPQVVLVATGSEVALAQAAATQLSSDGVSVRVVSMPNPGLFLQQDAAYRNSVLPPDVNRSRRSFAVERVVCAVDCGVPINPDIIRAQMEGGIGFGQVEVTSTEMVLEKTIGPIVMSAVSSVTTPGVFETRMPRCRAVWTSIWSTPAP